MVIELSFFLKVAVILWLAGRAVCYILEREDRRRDQSKKRTITG
jgi:hypothetical protein